MTVDTEGGGGGGLTGATSFCGDVMECNNWLAREFAAMRESSSFGWLIAHAEQNRIEVNGT